MSATLKGGLQFDIPVPKETDLFAGYEAERAKSKVYWDEDLNGYAVLSMKSCMRVMRDEETFVHMDNREYVGDDEVYVRIQKVVGAPRALGLLSGAEYHALHGILAREVVRRTRLIRDRIIGLFGEYVDAMPERPEFNADVADLLPVAVIAHLLGLPTADDEEELTTILRLARDISAARQVPLDRDSGTWDQALESAETLRAILEPVVESRRDSDGDDLISRLWVSGRDVFDDWGAADIIGQAMFLISAGSRGSSEMLSNIAYTLAVRPELFELLKRDEGAIVGALEEMIRLVGPVQARPRIAGVDVEVDGVTIPKGSPVFVMLAAANRDPERYENPHTFDVEKPSRHISFNLGPRSCVGQSVARLQGESLIRALLKFDSIGLDPEAEQAQFIGRINRSFGPLHLLATRS